MSDMKRCLERQEREIKERRCKPAGEKRMQQEEDEQVAVVVGLLDLESQGHRCGSQVSRGPNVDRHRHSQGRYRMKPHLFNKVIHDVCNYNAYFVQKCDAAGVLGLLSEQKLTAVIRMLAYGSSTDQVDEIAMMRKSTTLESLVRFCDAIETLYTKDYLRKPTPRDLHGLLQKVEARGDYGNRKRKKSILLEAVVGFDTWVWHAFFGVAGSQNSLNVLGQSPVFNYVLRDEAPNITMKSTIPSTGVGYKKDVERCFGILQARWVIIKGDVRVFDEEVLRSIMMTCIIFHNMIVEDEYDYDAPDVFELDLMNMALIRIYERPIGPNGQSLEHELLVRVFY
ncbi:unnamed protein product [Prunus armeniaca]